MNITTIRKNATGLYHKGRTTYASTPACVGSVLAVIMMLLVGIKSLSTLGDVQGLNVFDSNLSTIIKVHDPDLTKLKDFDNIPPNTNV